MTSNVIPIRPNQYLPTGPEYEEPTLQEVRKLARALVIALNIAPGESLVLTLGKGSEASNFEAVVTWVQEFLVREGLPAQRAALSTLLPALEARLHTITETLAHF